VYPGTSRICAGDDLAMDKRLKKMEKKLKEARGEGSTPPPRSEDPELQQKRQRKMEEKAARKRARAILQSEVC